MVCYICIYVAYVGLPIYLYIGSVVRPYIDLYVVNGLMDRFTKKLSKKRFKTNF